MIGDSAAAGTEVARFDEHGVFEIVEPQFLGIVGRDGFGSVEVNYACSNSGLDSVCAGVNGMCSATSASNAQCADVNAMCNTAGYQNNVCALENGLC